MFLTNPQRRSTCNTKALEQIVRPPDHSYVWNQGPSLLSGPLFQMTGDHQTCFLFYPHFFVRIFLLVQQSTVVTENYSYINLSTQCNLFYSNTVLTIKLILDSTKANFSPVILNILAGMLYPFLYIGTYVFSRCNF